MDGTFDGLMVRCFYLLLLFVVAAAFFFVLVAAVVLKHSKGSFFI